MARSHLYLLGFLPALAFLGFAEAQETTSPPAQTTTAGTDAAKSAQPACPPEMSKLECQLKLLGQQFEPGSLDNLTAGVPKDELIRRSLEHDQLRGNMING